MVVDDLGVESQLKEFGNVRNVFDELIDSVEQDGKLIIITTNLNQDELIKKYGKGVYERLLVTTKRIRFNGESFRK